MNNFSNIISYRNNKKLFILYTLFTGKMFAGTTQVLFLSFKGFSFTEIMLITTIIGIVSLVLEIPSGMAADRIGCKKCILIGLFISIIGYFFMIFSDNFTHIICYSILMAIGEASVSGADYTLLYESFIKLQEEKIFKEYLRKLNSIKMYFVAIVTLFSGVLYEMNEYLPFLCTIFFYICAFTISLFFQDIQTMEERVSLREYFQLSVDSIKKNAIFRMLIFEGSMFTILFMNQNIFLQQYMSDIGVKVSLFGLVFFFYNLVTAFVSKRSGKLEDKFGKNIKVIFTLLICICFILAGIFHGSVGIVILALCRVSIATINPILDTQINECIKTNNRATLLSVYNAISSSVDCILSPFIGFGIDTIGISHMYVLIGILTIPFILYLLFHKTFSTQSYPKL